MDLFLPHLPRGRLSECYIHSNQNRIHWITHIIEWKLVGIVKNFKHVPYQGNAQKC